MVTPGVRTTTGIIPPNDLLQAYENMLDNGGVPQGLTINLPALDNQCRLDKGRLVTIAGDTQSGKSSLIAFLTARYYLEYGMNTLNFSAEWDETYHLGRLVDIVAASRGDEHFSRMEVARELVDHFFFLNRGEMWNHKTIIEACEGKIMSGVPVDILVIDCYNRLNNSQSTKTETEHIGEVLNELSRYAVARNILVIIAAHTRKREFGEPTLSDINGSQNYGNMSDFVLMPYRKDKTHNKTVIMVEKVKSSNYGSLGKVNLCYDGTTGIYYAPKDCPPSYQGVKDESETKKPEPKSGKEYLDVTVSSFKNARSSSPEDTNLLSFLISEQFEERISQLRNCTDEKEQKEMKKKLPAISVSARFQGGRKLEDIVDRTGLLCVDIDEQDNENIIGDVPAILKSLPYVAFFEKSCRGNGYLAIVPISDKDKFQEHFFALEKDFEELGIVIDKSCKDETRIRFATYDEDFYINPATLPYDKKIMPAEKNDSPIKINSTPTRPRIYSHSGILEELDSAVGIVESKHINVCPDYNSWICLGYALAYNLGEEGRRYFLAFSQFYPEYNEEECSKQYSACLRSRRSGGNYNSNSIFGILKKRGVTIHQNS